MSRRKKVRTTISFLRRPKKCLRRASHFLEFFRFFRGNMIRLRLIPAHLRCQKDAGFLAARKCMCGFVSLQLFSSHLNQSEPHSNQVNRRKIRTPAPNHPTGGCQIDFLVTRSCRQIALGASCDERLWPIEKYSSLADRNETSGPFSFYSAHIHPSTLSPTASISLTHTNCVEKPSCASFPSLARSPPLYKIAFPEKFFLYAK